MVDEYLGYLEAQCRLHDGQVLVAADGQDILGFVCVVASTRNDSPDDPAPFAWIHDIFVRASHRRTGIGGALLASAETYARSRGATLLRLGVLDRNAGARAFYRGHGFREYAHVVTKTL